MGKYFITGRPGSGKTTVIQELQRRGLKAYNTDDMPGVTELVDTESGKIVPWPEGTVDWKRYRWNWQDAEIRDLLNQDGDVFVGAIVGNQSEYYQFFDKVFALVLSGETVAGRLESHEHSRTPEEKANLIVAHEAAQQEWEDQKLILVSSEQPVGQIADEILGYLCRFSSTANASGVKSVFSS